MKKLTIIIPAYNEALSIQSTIDNLGPFAKKYNCEIIVVNDGSTDNTEGILKTMDNILVINHPHNKGYGAALKTGIRNSNGELVALYDADGQHNPEDVENLLDNFKNHDMLIGERGKDSHREWIRRPGKWVLSKVANYLTERKIPDLNSGLRIIKRDVITKLLHLFPDGFSFSTTSTIAFMNMGYNVGYYPIKVNKRVGKSSVKQLKHGSSTLLLILRIIVLFNPLKVFFPVSFFLFIIGVIYEILFGIIILAPNYKFIPSAFFMILSSILIFFFGLLADQISEMRKHML